ncbi:hypothetical protein BU204_17680 [Actinophytocola xanthii]|uniref:Uncharacterized protein n=2 Tax=Actinophytocola xanthii TaxID=1912961 RepID=A0A1Q8CPC2_9PSEU|nr:hypothetical protein BU204_17680 [Actinophytocola xanthii]
MVLAIGLVVGGVLLLDRPDLDEQLARRVVAALERADPDADGQAAHPGHGQAGSSHRRTDIDGHELVCAAETFGHEPPEATSIDEVTVVYAHRMCAAVGPGLVWPGSIRESGPVKLRLGVPDTLVLPEKALPEDADAEYADRIRAVVPRHYHRDALAYGDFVDPEVAEELQDQLDD